MLDPHVGAVHAPVHGCRGEAWMMAPESWDADKGSGMACCRLELAKKRRSDFQKTPLQKSQIRPRNAVEKTTSKEGDNGCVF